MSMDQQETFEWLLAENRRLTAALAAAQVERTPLREALDRLTPELVRKVLNEMDAATIYTISGTEIFTRDLRAALAPPAQAFDLASAAKNLHDDLQKVGEELFTLPAQEEKK
jgi:hypothetical protein